MPLPGRSRRSLAARWGLSGVLGALGVLAACAPMHHGGEAAKGGAGADAYLARHPDWHYRTIAPFYVHQRTQADCSVASTAILINALDRIAGRHDAPVGEIDVLAAVGDPAWTRAVADNGDGVSFAAFLRYLRASLDAFGFPAARIQVFHPTDAGPATRFRLRQLLADSARNRDSVLLAVFDQGTLTGGEHVGHVSPVAAYDLARGRVLILDVDRGVSPYWASEDRLLAALLVPDPTDPGGDGLVRVSLPVGVASSR